MITKYEFISFDKTLKMFKENENTKNDDSDILIMDVKVNGPFVNIGWCVVPKKSLILTEIEHYKTVWPVFSTDFSTDLFLYGFIIKNFNVFFCSQPIKLFFEEDEKIYNEIISKYPIVNDQYLLNKKCNKDACGFYEIDALTFIKIIHDCNDIKLTSIDILYYSDAIHLEWYYLEDGLCQPYKTIWECKDLTYENNEEIFTFVVNNGSSLLNNHFLKTIADFVFPEYSEIIHTVLNYIHN